MCCHYCSFSFHSILMFSELLLLLSSVSSFRFRLFDLPRFVKNLKLPCVRENSPCSNRISVVFLAPETAFTAGVLPFADLPVSVIFPEGRLSRRTIYMWSILAVEVMYHVSKEISERGNGIIPFDVLFILELLILVLWNKTSSECYLELLMKFI